MSDKSTINQSGKTHEYGERSIAKEQAAAWLLRLDKGPLSAEEKQALHGWLAVDEFHGEYLRKLTGNWDAMGVLQDLAELFPLPAQEALAAKHANADANLSWTQSLTAAFNVSQWRYAVASAFVCAAIAVSLFSGPVPTQGDFRTAVGEQASFALSDGSTLLLNTNSLISVDFSGDKRVLRLRHGEMHVDVAKDREHPFVVYAGGGLVRAVGTAFNVRLGEDEVDVLVTEGRVRVFANSDAQVSDDGFDMAVAPDARQTLLEAGQAVQYSEVIGVIEAVEPERLENKLAWKKGGLVFKGETLEHALAEISRYTHKELVIVDPSIKYTRVGGHYKTDDIDSLMLTLSRGLGLQMEFVSDKQILLSAK